MDVGSPVDGLALKKLESHEEWIKACGGIFVSTENIFNLEARPFVIFSTDYLIQSASLGNKNALFALALCHSQYFSGFVKNHSQVIDEVNARGACDLLKESLSMAADSGHQTAVMLSLILKAMEDLSGYGDFEDYKFPIFDHQFLCTTDLKEYGLKLFGSIAFIDWVNKNPNKKMRSDAAALCYLLPIKLVNNNSKKIKKALFQAFPDANKFAKFCQGIERNGSLLGSFLRLRMYDNRASFSHRSLCRRACKELAASGFEEFNFLDKYNDYWAVSEWISLRNPFAFFEN